MTSLEKAIDLWNDRSVTLVTRARRLRPKVPDFGTQESKKEIVKEWLISDDSQSDAPLGYLASGCLGHILSGYALIGSNCQLEPVFCN